MPQEVSCLSREWWATPAVPETIVLTYALPTRLINYLPETKIFQLLSPLSGSVGEPVYLSESAKDQSKHKRKQTQKERGEKKPVLQGVDVGMIVTKIIPFSKDPKQERMTRKGINRSWGWEKEATENTKEGRRVIERSNSTLM